MKTATLTAAVLTAFLVVGGVAHANNDAGWHARVDALLLSANVSGQGFQRIFQVIPDGVYFGGNLDGGLQGGYRLVGGKENCEGLGVQFQFFNFDNAVGYNGEWENGVDLDFVGELDVDVYAFDAEVTQRAEFRRWDLLVGGGLRVGGVGIHQDGSLYPGVASFYGVPSGVDFVGIGPTLSASAERPLGSSGLSVVGRARVALLFGELEQTPTFGALTPPILARTENEFVQVTEIQFGMNYRKGLGSADGTFGVFWEAQRWDSDSGALRDLALHGLSLQTGLIY